MDELEAIKQIFAGLTPEQREQVVANYCKSCWEWDPSQTCCQDGGALED